ncbi:MAG: RNA polymerase sigma-70 factor [Cytophagales bacterium]|nr:RNA polymerase sigma-70 factor [Cytophagales bacterium]
MQKSDPTGLDYLFDCYGGKLYNMSYSFLKSREDAEEAVQDVLLKIWQNRSKLEDDYSLEGYLFRITKNHLLNKIRDKARKSLVSVDLRTDVADGFATDQALLMEDMQLFLARVIEGLPSRRQRIFRMSRMQHMSNQQIAQELGISEKTVENQIGKALKYLRTYINYTYLILAFIF